MPPILTRAAISAAALAVSSAAGANAWPQPEGEGRVINTIIYSVSDRAFDSDGDVVDIGDYRQFQIYMNADYGLTDDLTLLLTPSVRDIDVEGEPFRDESGFQFLDVGARYRLAQLGSTVVSLQAKGRIPFETHRDPLGQVSIQGFALDVRGQVGHGFQLAGMESFAIGEAGYVFREDDPPNEFALDFALGARVAPDVLLIANSFNTFSDGAGSNGFPSYRYHNVMLSGVYDVSDNISLQLGGMFTIDGESALRERGIVGGLWFRF